MHPCRAIFLALLLLSHRPTPGHAQPLQLGPSERLEPGSCLALAPADGFDFAALIDLPPDLLADQLLEAVVVGTTAVTDAGPIIHYSTRSHDAPTSQFPATAGDSFLALWRGLLVLDAPTILSLGVRVDDTMALRCSAPNDAAPIIAIAAPPVLGAPETWLSRVFDFPEAWRLPL